MVHYCNKLHERNNSSNKDHIGTIIVFLIVIVFLFASCDKNNEENTQPATSTESTDITAITSIAPPASTVGTDTLLIDGVLYRNNFQSGMTLSCEYYQYEEIMSGGKYLYRVTDVPFDLIYDPDPNITRNIGVSDVIYCRDDQWQNLHTYYSNPNNYTYCYIAVDKNNNFNEHIIAEPDKEKFDKIINWYEENNFNIVNAVVDPKLPYPILNDNTYTKYRFTVETKDKIFSKGAGDFYVQNGKLSLIYTKTMLTGTTLVIDAPDELTNYFIALIKNKTSQTST